MLTAKEIAQHSPLRSLAPCQPPPHMLRPFPLRLRSRVVLLDGRATLRSGLGSIGRLVGKQIPHLDPNDPRLQAAVDQAGATAKKEGEDKKEDKEDDDSKK